MKFIKRLRSRWKLSRAIATLKLEMDNQVNELLNISIYFTKQEPHNITKFYIMQNVADEVNKTWRDLNGNKVYKI